MKTSNNFTHFIDIYVGQRLRWLRKKKGYSQRELAEKVNITFQQVQKYERGMNRISCSKLYEFSSFLEVNINFFFKDLKANSTDNHYTLNDSVPIKCVEGFEEEKLLESYRKITDAGLKILIRKLVLALATKEL